MQTMKKPLLVSASVLGLTLALSACSTTPQEANGYNTQDGRMMGHHQHGDDRDGRGDDDHGDRHGHGGMRGGMGHGMKDLNLTDAQKAQIQQLREQQKVQRQQFKATMAQYDANIAQQKQAGASADTLLNLYKQKQAAMEQGMASMQQQKQQFMNILTPEQQLKLYQGRDH